MVEKMSFEYIDPVCCFIYCDAEVKVVTCSFLHYFPKHYVRAQILCLPGVQKVMGWVGAICFTRWFAMYLYDLFLKSESLAFSVHLMMT